MQPIVAHDTWYKKLYRGVVLGENSLGHILLLLIRLYWGVLMIMAGLGKWMNISGVSQYFDGLGIPYPLFNAYLVGTIEVLGGLSFILGLASRLFSILIVALYITAYMTAHSEAVINLFSNPSLFTTQEPFLFLYAGIIILCFGPGIFSCDYWIERKVQGRPL